jgi:uncharacterized protein (TIGR02466 family)
MKSAQPGTVAPAPGGTGGALVREQFFPTLVYYRDLPDGAALNAALKPALYAWRAADPAGIERSNARRVGAWHSALDLQTRPECRRLTDTVLATAGEIFAQLGYDPAYEPVVDNMWANVNPPGAYNRRHVHPNILWSGVYWVQAPPECGRLLLTDPRPSAEMLPAFYAPGSPLASECWSEVFYVAREGRLLLFPAWLPHEVEANRSDRAGAAADRISVSFNLFMRRRPA